jgi:hypothetical protein
MRRVRVVAVTLQAAVVVALASPGAAALHAWPTSGPAETTGPPSQPAPVATAVELVAVPDVDSFDDLGPSSTSSRATSTAPTAPRAATARRSVPPRPVDMPPKGTAQYVLATAYRSAVAAAPATCHLGVHHLAAIGQVESGSVGGRSVTPDHRVWPAIYGPLLDGGPFAVVHDSDGGAVDGAGDFDRAVGPLQFLPGTWRWAGADGDRDGWRDPQNVFDASLATAGYLCRGGRDLSASWHLRSAVLSYNQSDAYLRSVLDWADYFARHGLSALDDVAFRVGSGGRASDLVEPVAPPPPPSPSGAQSSSTAPSATSSARPSVTPSTPSAPGSPTTPADPPEDGPQPTSGPSPTTTTAPTTPSTAEATPSTPSTTSTG